MHAHIDQLIVWYQTNIDSVGYVAIALMMAVESTFLPIPSESVIPFAARHADRTGQMTLPGIILAGALGSWVGASLMYWVSRWAGRAMLNRYGWYFLVTEVRLGAAEQWAVQFGPYFVFVTRLLPVVRHLIGVPMGLVKMNFLLYTVSTLFGSAIWCLLLASLGRDFASDPAALQNDLHRVTVWLLGLTTFVVLLYYFLIHPFLWDIPKKRKLRSINPPAPNILSFSGRVSRELFWFTWAFMAIMSLMARVMVGPVSDVHGLHLVRLVLYILGLILWVWIGTVVQGKRWHDLGRSAWMVCLNFIPVVGTLWSFAQLGFRGGACGPNEYGEDPVTASRF